MGIVAINVNTTGLVGKNIEPRRCTMITTDSLSTITTAGYLNNQNLSGNNILPTDVFEILYSFNESTQVGTFGIFQVLFSSSTGFTLNIWENPGDVLLPVVNNHLAAFNGTTGQIYDNGYVPSDTTKTLVVMSSGTIVSGNAPQFSDTSGTLIDSGIAGNRMQFALFNNPSASSNLISFRVTPSSLNLASGGKVNIVVSSGSRQYRIHTLYLGASTNFSGGGGDRLGRITDGFTVYSVIPAANMQALTNDVWGSTPLPLPATVVPPTLTTPGANLYVEYQGGTTDYTAGLMDISGLLERVA